MSSTVTVRDIDPADKAWLKREARHSRRFYGRVHPPSDPREARQGRAPRDAFRGFQAVFRTRARGRAAGAWALRIPEGRVRR